MAKKKDPTVVFSFKLGGTPYACYSCDDNGEKIPQCLTAGYVGFKPTRCPFNGTKAKWKKVKKQK
ncbi:MAG: hypothetical protein IMZ53_06085 [Thermoplasmata archaeon]|nr:hypothetical protein [Thermoplasmata archaeon]